MKSHFRFANRVLSLLFFSFVVQSPQQGLAGPRDCVLNGKAVNPDNGSYFVGQTGIMKCTDPATQTIIREQEYKNGKAVGLDMMIAYDGNKIVSHVNEKGNRHGSVKTYSPTGVLLSDENYENADQVGVQKHFFQSGKLKDLQFYLDQQMTTEIEYNEFGKITDLRCGPRSLLKEDRALCGFAGTESLVELYDSGSKVVRKVTYKDGKLVTRTDLSDSGAELASEKRTGDRKVLKKNFANGKLKNEMHFRENRLDGSEKEYHESGKLIRETNWAKGYPLQEVTYYLNGEVKERTQREKSKDGDLVAREEFWDNGKPKVKGRYIERTERFGQFGLSGYRWKYEDPDGQVRHFDEEGRLTFEGTFKAGKKMGVHQFYLNGKPQAQETYVDDKLTAKKVWDKDGALVEDDEYFEDGSRKKKK